ncbi:MAG: DUF3540 domain-containing protein [Planctomycetes bacterium]|nr:DUF3540 domain-containing protein [Planctomycetota bacterium]
MTDTATIAAPRLGPALVLAIEGPRLRVQHEGREAAAVNALAFPYRPAAGDMVLVIAQDEALYVIGVLQGRGDSAFSFPADVSLNAPHGSITLAAGRGIELQAPQVKVTAGRLELLARHAVEKFGQAARWVKELFQLRAGRTHTVVQGDAYERANARHIRAAKDVSVNGERIHLG